MNASFKKLVAILFILVNCSANVFAQQQDSVSNKEKTNEANPISKTTTVNAGVSVTNNGISLVPAFSLEKPAVLFDVYIKRKRFSFEPELAFGFKQAKPWYFVFWLKYKLIEKSKFNLTVSAHPGFLFNTVNVIENGSSKEYFTSARFFVGAISPSYTFSKHFSAGLYYQYARGYNIDLKNAQFFGITTIISNMNITPKIGVKVTPQLYFLKNDDKRGSYVSTQISISHKKYPFSLASLFNSKIKSAIPSKNFLWNLTLTYSL